MTRPDMLASPTRAVVSTKTIRGAGQAREHAERDDEARAGGDDHRRAQLAQHADRAHEVRQHADRAAAVLGQALDPLAAAREVVGLRARAP